MSCKFSKDNKECNKRNCRHWINYPEDDNCVLVAVEKHGSMTLEQIAERLGYTHQAISYMEKNALEKFEKRMENLEKATLNE